MSDQSSKSLLKRVWTQYIRFHLGKLGIAVLFMLLESAAMYVFVKSLQPLFDDIFTEGQRSMLLPVTLAVCGVFVLRGISSFCHRSLVVKTGVTIVGDMQKDLTTHLLTLDMDFFSKHAPGNLIERVRGDTQALKGFVSGAFITLGRDTALFFGMLIVALQVDVLWTLTVFIGLPLLLIPMAIVQKAIRRLTRKARASSADLTNRLDEIFHGIKAIKLNNLDDHEEDRFDQGLRKYVGNNLKSEYGRALMPSIIDILAGMGFVAVIYFGGQQIIDGTKSAGTFISFFTAVALMIDPLRRLTNITSGIQVALANLERIYYLFDLKATPRPAAINAFNNSKGDIEFKHVDFAYGDVPVLRDLSFKAAGGKTTAFVGPSGAGKTTLFNVLTHLELPAQGSIEIGGQALKDIRTKDLWHEIAVVSQESALFDESIRDNIRLGDISASDEKLQAVADKALVTRFAEELPDGLDSLAGPRGTNLSGGQRQRVIIARALLRDAPILLLDEATSALDNQTEKQIQQLLDDFAKEKTTLVIAHRLSTVMNADMIHVMKDGAIVESGTHEELLKLDNHYAQLHKTLES